jgi:hypothetical protein
MAQHSHVQAPASHCQDRHHIHPVGVEVSRHDHGVNGGTGLRLNAGERVRVGLIREAAQDMQLSEKSYRDNTTGDCEWLTTRNR